MLKNNVLLFLDVFLDFDMLSFWWHESTESSRRSRLRAGEEGDRGWDGGMTSPTFFWAISRREGASWVVLVVKTLPANAGDVKDASSTPGSGSSPGGAHGNPLRCSCLEDPHGQRSLAGYGPRGCRVGHDRATEQKGSRLTCQYPKVLSLAWHGLPCLPLIQRFHPLPGLHQVPSQCPPKEEAPPSPAQHFPCALHPAGP